MPILGFYMNDNDDDDDEVYEKEEETEDLLDLLVDLLEAEDIYCKQCGTLVEDGFQCDICGWMVEII
jgi:rubrerythrin